MQHEYTEFKSGTQSFCDNSNPYLQNRKKAFHHFFSSLRLIFTYIRLTTASSYLEIRAVHPLGPQHYYEENFDCRTKIQ